LEPGWLPDRLLKPQLDLCDARRRRRAQPPAAERRSRRPGLEGRVAVQAAGAASSAEDSASAAPSAGSAAPTADSASAFAAASALITPWRIARWMASRA